jgi:hypothetical protein
MDSKTKILAINIEDLANNTNVSEQERIEQLSYILLKITKLKEEVTDAYIHKLTKLAQSEKPMLQGRNALKNI